MDRSSLTIESGTLLELHVQPGLHHIVNTTIASNKLWHWGILFHVQIILELNGVLHVKNAFKADQGRLKARQALELREGLSLHLHPEWRMHPIYLARHHQCLLLTPTKM